MRKTIFTIALPAPVSCHQEELIDMPLRLQQNETIVSGSIVDESPRMPQPRGATLALTVAARTPETAEVPAAEQRIPAAFATMPAPQVLTTPTVILHGVDIYVPTHT